MKTPTRPSAGPRRQRRLPFDAKAWLGMTGPVGETPHARRERLMALFRWRLRLATVLFAVCFVAVTGQLVALMAFPVPHGTEAEAAAEAEAPVRGQLLDRNGHVLATTARAVDLYADPLLVQDTEATADRISEVLPHLDRSDLVEALGGPGRFTYIERGITPREQSRINRLGLPGIDFTPIDRRLYPAGPLVAHVTGLTNSDGTGIRGMELALEDRLSAGEDVRLSIDLRVQGVVADIVSAAMAEFSAIGAAALVLDVGTGEVLSLVSLPDFHPYRRESLAGEAGFNRATLGTYELGSTFKVFNTAIGLDTGTVRLTDRFDASEPIRFGRHLISDYRGENRLLTVPEVFVHSSNIGSVRLYERFGREMQRRYFERLGLLDPLPLELPESGSPQLPNNWGPLEAMTMAFGHGLSVTPTHLATAMAAMVNGGVLHPPTLLARGVDGERPLVGTQVIAPGTSATLRRLLYANVAYPEGSGNSAFVPGYAVGGKTGTAEKPAGSGYSEDARISSFVAAFPMTDPRYAVFVMLDEPQATRRTFGFATGGWVAAPAVGRIIARIGPMLGVPTMDETRPEIRSALFVPLTPEDTLLARFAPR